MDDYICFLSRSGYLYRAKRIRGASPPEYRLYVRLKRSGTWMLLPGMPPYMSIGSANNKLRQLADLNGWDECTPQGIKLKKEGRQYRQNQKT